MPEPTYDSNTQAQLDAIKIREATKGLQEQVIKLAGEVLSLSSDRKQINDLLGNHENRIVSLEQNARNSVKIDVKPEIKVETRKSIGQLLKDLLKRK